jgi:hypothetical protein
MATFKFIKIDPERSDSDGQSIWFAIEWPNVGWKRFPLNRALLVSRGKKRLPDLAGQVIRTALVYVQVYNRKAVGVSKIEIDTWTIDSDGRVDQGEAMSHIKEKLNGGPGVADQTPSVADVAAIKHCLGIRSAY